MLTIYKYRLGSDHGPRAVAMPAGAVVLSAGVDFEGHACVWARVDMDEVAGKDQPRATRRLFAAYTGQPLPEDVAASRFIGTAVTRSGLVLHIFDLGEA